MYFNEQRKKDIVDIVKLFLLGGLLYLLLSISLIEEKGNFFKNINHIFLEYIKVALLPFTGLTFIVMQISIAYNNREMSRKKNLIELEDKTSKEFAEIKELLQGITETNSDSYKELLSVLKIKEKSVEEKLLDKMEGKRFKYSLKFDNEKEEYKKQINKMNKIIIKGIENTSFFLLDDTIFNLSEEDINKLKFNSKRINQYFLKENMKEISLSEEIKLEINELLNELKEVTGSEKIEQVKKSLEKIAPTKDKEIITWLEVKNLAQEMIYIIDKI